MKRWFTLVVPIWWPLGLFVGASLVFSGVDWYLARAYSEEIRAAAQLDKFAVAAVVFAGAFYAILRVLGCHPLYNTDYARWLAQTPWNARKPLPLGPMRLVPQDALVVAVLALMAWVTYPSLTVFAVPWAFCGLYVLLNWLAFWPTGQRFLTFAVAFAAGLVVCLLGNAWWSASALALVLILTDVGLRRSLAAFPWHVGPEDLWWRGERLAAEMRSGLGWPYDQLRSPKEGPVIVSPVHGIVSSALLGWWAYALLASAMRLDPFDDRDPAFSRAAYAAAAGLSVLFAVYRIVLYCRNHRTPISRWGRLRTGRLLVPGYDRVLLAPLLTVSVGVLMPVLMTLLDVTAMVGAPLTGCLALVVALTLGPGLHNWRLTGMHRIVPGTRYQAQYIRL